MMKKWRRILPLLLAALMLAAVLPVKEEGGVLPVAQAVSQKDIDKLKDDKKGLTSEKKDIQDQLSQLKNDKNNAIQRRTLLDQQISVTEREIKNTEDQISGYEALLSQTALELEENRREEEQQYALFCERARVMEESGTTTYWSVLFKADSFSDLLSRLSDVQEVMNYDQAVLDQLRDRKSVV